MTKTDGACRLINRLASTFRDTTRYDKSPCQRTVGHFPSISQPFSETGMVAEEDFHATKNDLLGNLKRYNDPYGESLQLASCRNNIT